MPYFCFEMYIPIYQLSVDHEKNIGHLGYYAVFNVLLEIL